MLVEVAETQTGPVTRGGRAEDLITDAGATLDSALDQLGPVVSGVAHAAARGGRLAGRRDGRVLDQAVGRRQRDHRPHRRRGELQDLDALVARRRGRLMPDTIPEYDELKLRVEPRGAGQYDVVAFAPDGGTATGHFESPDLGARARQLHPARGAAAERPHLPLDAHGGGEGARAGAVRAPDGRRRGRRLPRRAPGGGHEGPRPPHIALDDGRAGAGRDPVGAPLRPERGVLPLAVDLHAGRALARPEEPARGARRSRCRSRCSRW